MIVVIGAGKYSKICKRAYGNLSVVIVEVDFSTRDVWIPGVCLLKLCLQRVVCYYYI